MPRGYRSVVIAGLGCLIASASPPRDSAGSKQTQAYREIAERLRDLNATIQSANETRDLNKPCDQGQANRNSQLCAQWQSVDQAERSGDWARRSFILGIFGAVIGLFTLGAAFAAALFAKRAADETWRSANEAEKSSGAAIETVALSRAALASGRPWICPEGITEKGDFSGTSRDGTIVTRGMHFGIGWKNLGQTPAIKVTAYSSHKVFVFGSDVPTFEAPMSPDDDFGITGPQGIFRPPAIEINDSETDAFRARKCLVALYSKVFYRDTFDNSILHESECCIVAHHHGGQKQGPDGKLYEAISFFLIGPQNRVT